MIAPAKLKELSVESDLHGFVQLGSHLGALVLSAAALLLTWGTFWAIPAFIVHGTLINFLYAGQHELSHWTVFRTKGLNELFGRGFGFLLFYPRDFDQVQHFAHHRFTQNWERDGELARDRYTLASYLLWMLGPTYWYTRVRRILRFSLGIVLSPSIPQARRAGLAAERGGLDGLDGLEHAVPHRPSRLPGRALLPPASAASGNLPQKEQHATHDVLSRLPIGGVPR